MTYVTLFDLLNQHIDEAINADSVRERTYNIKLGCRCATHIIMGKDYMHEHHHDWRERASKEFSMVRDYTDDELRAYADQFNLLRDLFTD